MLFRSTGLAVDVVAHSRDELCERDELVPVDIKVIGGESNNIVIRSGVTLWEKGRGEQVRGARWKVV